MKKITLSILGLLIFTTIYSQVGINTIDPNVTFHVKPTSTSSSTAEGIIAPNLTREQLISKDLKYNTDEKGAIVYVTDLSGTLTAKTALITNVGYYYFDGSEWQAFGKNINAINGLTLADNQLSLGGDLTEDTKISSKENKRLTFDIPVTTNNLTINGQLGLSGDFSSTGTTTLTTVAGDAIIFDASVGQGLIIKDGQTDIGGKFLQADSKGKASWQAFGSKNSTPQVVFAEANGVYYNPIEHSSVDTKTSITLPKGKWLVQCALLFIINEVNSVNATNNTLYSHWVQIRMNPATGSGAKSIASLVSGNIYKNVKYNTLSGYFIVENNTETEVKYSFTLTAAGNTEGSIWPKTIATQPTTSNQTNGQFVQAFARNNGENAIVAFQLTD